MNYKTKFLFLLTFILFVSCNYENNKSDLHHDSCLNIKSYYKQLFNEKPSVKDTLLSIINKLEAKRRENYIFCLIQKSDNMFNPKLQLEYTPLLYENIITNLPIDTIKIGNSTLYIYDVLFSKVEILKQAKSKSVFKYINSLGIDTSLLNSFSDGRVRNQASIEIGFFNIDSITSKWGVESFFMPPLAKTVKFR